MARRLIASRDAVANNNAAALDPREIAALQAEILRARLAEEEALKAADAAKAALCKCLCKEKENKSKHRGCGCRSKRRY